MKHMASGDKHWKRWRNVLYSEKLFRTSYWERRAHRPSDPDPDLSEMDKAVFSTETAKTRKMRGSRLGGVCRKTNNDDDDDDDGAKPVQRPNLEDEDDIKINRRSQKIQSKNPGKPDKQIIDNVKVLVTKSALLWSSSILIITVTMIINCVHPKWIMWMRLHYACVVGARSPWQRLLYPQLHVTNNCLVFL